jgi:hypothetical protein
MMLVFESVQMSRFARPERDDEAVNWYRLGLDETDTLNIANVLIGHAQDFVAFFNYRLPDRHVENNGIGMMVNLVEPIIKDGWEICAYYMTQKSLVYDVIAILENAKVKFEDADQKSGKGTKADPEIIHMFETATPKKPVVVSIEHKKGQGNRTKYVATGGQETL